MTKGRKPKHKQTHSITRLPLEKATQCSLCREWLPIGYVPCVDTVDYSIGMKSVVTYCASCEEKMPYIKNIEGTQ